MNVDPDGELAMLFAIAGFSLGMMGTAMHADNNGINLTGGDLLLAGAQWGAAAAGAYSLVSAATAAAAAGGATKAAGGAAKTVAAKSAGVKLGIKSALKAGLKSGTINALSNYNFDNGWNDLGFETFADFGAGFAGGATAVGGNSKLLGMAVGGGLNLAFNAQDGDGGYKYAQNFVGGALSVYSGTGKLVKGNKLASKPFWKGVETFGKYGIQSTAYDFAYTKEKYFTGRTGWEHAGIFAVGGMAGVGAEHFLTNRNMEISSFARLGSGAGVYAAEWMITSRIKHGSYARYNGYSPGGFYTGRSQQAKGWISGLKWALPSFDILFGQ